MYFKVLGALITVLGTSFYGWYLAGQIVNKINRMTSFKESLLIMSGHIRYARISMPMLLRSISEAVVHKGISDFYYVTSERIGENTGEDFADIWKDCIETCFKDNISKEEIRIYKEIGELPVYMDVVMQIQFLEEKITFLEEVITRTKAELLQKDKVYKCLGISVGLLIVLVLI